MSQASDEVAQGPIDVDAILASLGDEFNDPGLDPWGGANLDPGPRTPVE